MKLLFSHPFVRVAALVALQVAALWLVLASAGPARAAGVVTNCTQQGLGAAMNSGSGPISFSCGPDPVVIIITQTGGLNAIPGTFYTIDGGNKVTLTGGGTTRLFDVWSNAALTLTNIILTDGHAFTDAVHLPDSGGAILAEGTRLVLDHVTIRNSHSSYAGGALQVIAGEAIVKDSLIENNQSIYGGGISHLGMLTVINTIIRGNQANRGGGGLLIGGPAVISNSQIVSNTALGVGSTDLDGGGGLNIDSTGSASISGSLFNANQADTLTVGRGGAIRSTGTLTVTQSAFSGNSAAQGGGLYSKSIVMTLTASSLDSNSAGTGGGLYLQDSTVLLNDLTLRANTAITGGGIYIGASIITLNNSTLSGNSASIGGGIVNSGGGILFVNGSTLSANSAVDSGGGLISNGNAVLTNATLSGNSAGTAGGGIYNSNYLDLLNVTLSNNTAANGGALHMAVGHITVLTNTILAYSPAGGNCSGTFTAEKYSLSSDNSCALTGLVHGLDANNVDPLLTALGNYGGPTLVNMLKLGSPAIAGVVGNDSPLIDQRGQPRPGPDGNRDIGAVERQPADSDLAPRLYLPLLER